MSSRLRQTALSAALVVPAAVLAFASWSLPRSLGASRARIRPYAAGSPQFRDGGFHNSQPSTVVRSGEQGSLLRAVLTRSGVGRPAHAVPLATTGAPTSPADLAVTWLGHASALVEIDGAVVLLDPMWSQRCSPSPVLGPRRLHPAPVALADLPQLDAVIISHDHYDHLDLPTVRTLLHTQTAPFVVPLGVGAHLRKWGVPDERILERDWEQHTEIAGLTLTCTESRHFSGRGLKRNTTLWASWVIAGPQHRVFFGGDSGYTPAFATIGAQSGPFDLTLLPIGAYGEQWPDIHMNPEEAVRAHGDLGGGLLVPIHWATFNLAFHGWAEPAERVRVAAEEHNVALAIPRPGERVVVAEPPELTDWWSVVA
ncbi:MAG: MBL fold metallo-hydrolase [Mycobacteriaceae bacterium]